MKVLMISGSSSLNSSNKEFLESLSNVLSQDHEVKISQFIGDLPLFLFDKEDVTVSASVVAFKNEVLWADLIVISTPEYLFNIPAVLKNALEWLTKSGELNKKRVLALSLTPHKPRGGMAMISLKQSLKALDANVLACEQLYKTDFTISKTGKFTSDKDFESLNYLLNSL